jgi:glycosyltransferase involved in cell wall biosynthesis
VLEELGLPEQDQMIAAAPRAEMTPPRSAATDQPILMITGGGLENGGGIGRMVGYVVAAWNSPVRPRMQVIDTRGPKYRRAVWPFFLLNSIFQIVKRAPQRPLLHVHLAANTSTLRKVIVTSVGRALGLKYVIHLHDPKYAEFYLRQRPWSQARIRSMYLGASRAIALGRPAANMMADLLGLPRERIDIVPNAVPGPENLVRKDRKADGAEARIVFLGQLQRRKGVHDLIDALAREEVVGLRWRTILAGGGADQAEFEAQAVQAGLKDRIEFPGWLTEQPIRALLESADILVLPSYAEEMAMSVLEGMAFGLCLICTPVGAQAEVVEDGVSAVVVTPGDVQGLAAALARCIADPELRFRLGRGARKAYLERYNIADYPELIAAVYRRV